MNSKMFKSERAVSPVIGIIIILGLTILSISTILIYSVPTLDGLEDMAKAQKVEQAFTVFDSRVSKVALGESPVQTTYVSLMGGTINVNGDQDAYNDSQMVIFHIEADDDDHDDFMEYQNRYTWGSWEGFIDDYDNHSDGDDLLICSLGTIEYSLGDRIIAYEGGGVWSKYPTGSSIMISPPEFHYNGETLTLPIMKINGRSGVSGTGDVGVTISSDSLPDVLFPSDVGDDRENPLDPGKVMIFIKSDLLICSLGTIEYSLGDRIIAYEGGGVWSKYPTGSSIMISPPEFHYNGETLTLPIMKINGRSGVSGTGDVGVTISSDSLPDVLFPSDVGDDRENPLDPGKVMIFIKSDYYVAWAEYANSQTYTTAVIDAANKTAIVELEVAPPMGTFALDDEFDVGKLNQTSDVPMTNFSFDFVAKGAQGLNPSKYEISAESGTRTLTYTLQKTDGLSLDVEYRDTAVGSEYIEFWSHTGSINKSGNPETSTVDFLDDTYMMKYDPPKENKGGARPDFSWTEYIISLGNESFSLNDLTQHYMKLITENGAVEFDIDGGSQDPVDYDASSITLYYDGEAGAITYLHISQNELDAAVTT